MSTNSTSADSSLATNEQHNEVEITLYEMAKKSSSSDQRIIVEMKNIFTLKLNGISYDLADHFQASDLSGLPNPRYTVNLSNDDLQSLEIDLSLNGKNYSLTGELSDPLSVINHTHLSEQYLPLEDDIQLDWNTTESETEINISQSMTYNDQTSCHRGEFSTVLSADVITYHLFQVGFNQDCSTENKQKIITRAVMTQSYDDLKINFSGFKQAQLSSKNQYYWDHLLEF
ncbi:hypothetical protein JQC92_17355 [Shewanella sp. 202IG2-18]|uniref:hypothetical protein n=1 Tax=Parashewanella hymeniacidonis TaxID=2807618 RepID=UPI00195FAE07|nr:hypothetical protein [Parashewanella hymeniacidonis]MBM7073780.1 hypothetical protein [Parashewanella hymeniacidonis]